MKRILVTAIGGDISQSITQCLKDSDEIFIVGTDVHDKHAGKLFVDSNNYFYISMDKDGLYKIKFDNFR